MEREKFTVRFAQTQEEKNAVYALRYRDMILEYQQDATNATELDVTPYDEHARQIICIDNDTGEIVGSYRIITTQTLPKDKPFLCEEEFTLQTLKATGEKIAELSRAVIKKSYRNTTVLMLLLRFIVQYVREQNIRFVVGDASFCGIDKHAYQKELSYLTHFHAIDDVYQIYAREDEQIQLLSKDLLNAQEIKRSLPTLIRAYLSFGAKVSKHSFTDKAFGSVDVFILLDTQNYNASYINKLLRL